MDLLRFITAGSVDDGKSTLIGRLLYDTDSILEDQLEAISLASKSKEDGEIDLALLTDGLRAEREQGITIDVAYKYFQTARRKFIIADTPGHIQYTRNMVTGASNSQVAIILVDARKGVIEQTRRHSFICSLLGLEHLIIAINKMDLIDFSQSQYDTIVADYLKLAAMLQVKNLHFIPISALKGDNIVSNSQHMPWYQGSSLLDLLENLDANPSIQDEDARFQVQFVIRPQTEALPDYRGYAGKVLKGYYQKGDDIVVLPSQIETKIKSIEFDQKEIEQAISPMSVIVHLEDDIDVSRGDFFVKKHSNYTTTQEIEATICWFDETKSLLAGNKYLLQQGSKTVKCVVRSLKNKINIQTLEKIEEVEKFQLNDLGEVSIKTALPILGDGYKSHVTTGGFILIDEYSHQTVAAGMIL